MSEWQPIETAPKDGRKILLWCPTLNNMIQAQWRVHDMGGEWVDIWNNDPIEDMQGVAYPTHWMPLPNPPETK